MKILLASTNRNKANELNILTKEHSVILPEDIGIEFDYEETALTFHENAIGKAAAFFDLVKMPVIAEDSGLCVPALGGDPGVFSARYGSDGIHKLSDSDRNSYLLKKMEHIDDRYAFYICSMVFLVNKSRFYVCQETLEGEILREPKGANGFGYDPIFYIPELNKTAAELTAEEKNLISHRGKAGRLTVSLMEKIL